MSETIALDTVVDDYFTMFNETDADQRAKVIARTWSADAGYLDPLLSASGADELNAMVGTVHQQYPGHRFALTGPIDAHHDRARWSWELRTPAGEVFVTGVDYAVLAADGRLRTVTGFFEPQVG